MQLIECQVLTDSWDELGCEEGILLYLPIPEYNASNSNNIQILSQLGMVVHACNFRTTEVAEESAGVRVHTEFEASLDYINKYVYFLE